VVEALLRWGKLNEDLPRAELRAQKGPTGSIYSW